MHPLADSSESRSHKRTGAESAHGTGARFSVKEKDGGRVFVFSGELTVRHVNDVEADVRKAVTEASQPVAVDLQGLTGLDTNGALLINLALQGLEEKGVAYSLPDTDPLYKKLLETARLDDEEDAATNPPPGLLLFLNNTGKAISEAVCLTGQLVGFLGKFLVTLWGLVRHPGRMRWTSLVFHMEQTGVKAVPIVTLLTFLIGMVVAYMGAEQLQRFGAQIFAVNLLEVTVLREMAVLITAIVVAGRSSSSFTAQIGAMVANEEVDAMRSMGLDPDVLLVVPRVIALILCLPMLVFLADLSALAGGATAIWYTMGLSFSDFLAELKSVISLDNFFVGMVKTPFFATAIGLVGCFQGFRATSSAESVGFLTTISVVQSIFIVILLDALFAIFFTTIGI